MEVGGARVNKQIFVGTVALSAVALSVFAEFFLDQPICALCLAQRILWSLVLVSAVLWVFKSFFRRSCQILLVLTLLIASYHSLVQMKLIDDRCKAEANIADASSYKMLLTTKQKIGCSEIAWTIAGLPASMSSALASLLLLRFCKK